METFCKFIFRKRHLQYKNNTRPKAPTARNCFVQRHNNSTPKSRTDLLLTPRFVIREGIKQSSRSAGGCDLSRVQCVSTSPLKEPQPLPLSALIVYRPPSPCFTTEQNLDVVVSSLNLMTTFCSTFLCFDWCDWTLRSAPRVLFMYGVFPNVCVENFKV